MADYREEKDTMGTVRVPSDVWYGAQTQRASDNFQISPFTLPDSFIRALALVKMSAARANFKLNLLDNQVYKAIVQASEEVIKAADADNTDTRGKGSSEKDGIFAGSLKENFPLDIFQTGSATSTNMNMNEVIANRANVILGGRKGERFPVHPNDHVNKSQSSNDVIPTALHISNRMEAEKTIDSLNILKKELEKKAKEFSSVIKLGRTHLQDAVPITLGDEFSSFAKQISKGIGRLENTFDNLEELAIGGTAVGSGLNCPEGFASAAVEFISQECGVNFREAENRFEAISSRDAQVELMGALNTIAVSLGKIAEDLRLLSSGPRGGLGEIELPALQPGSSIMPGKVNPVIPEMVLQVSSFVTGMTSAVTAGGLTGPLQLNMAHPLIAWATLNSLEALGNASESLALKCVSGIKANREKAEGWIENSLAMVTPVALRIGYDRAAEIAYKAYKNGKSIREVLLEDKVLPEEEIDKLLDPRKMI